MGYRSEVKIVTTREGYERICKRVDELNADMKACQLLGAGISPEYFEESNGCVVFGWDWIRWYDGTFADVTNVSTALRELADDDIPYEFCRIGEEWDHIEPTSSINVYS